MGANAVRSPHSRSPSGKSCSPSPSRRHRTSRRWPSAGTAGSRRCTAPVAGGAPAARHRLEHDLVDGDVAWLSRTTSACPARGGKPTFAVPAGRVMRLLPVVIARPAQASRAQGRGAPAGQGRGRGAQRQGANCMVGGGRSGQSTHVCFAPVLLRSPRCRSDRRRAHTPARPNVAWLKHGT